MLLTVRLYWWTGGSFFFWLPQCHYVGNLLTQQQAWLAQSVEHLTLRYTSHQKVAGSSPALGLLFCICFEYVWNFYVPRSDESGISHLFFFMAHLMWACCSLPRHVIRFTIWNGNVSSLIYVLLLVLYLFKTRWSKQTQSLICVAVMDILAAIIYKVYMILQKLVKNFCYNSSWSINNTNIWYIVYSPLIQRFGYWIYHTWSNLLVSPELQKNMGFAPSIYIGTTIKVMIYTLHYDQIYQDID